MNNRHCLTRMDEQQKFSSLSDWVKTLDAVNLNVEYEEVYEGSDLITMGFTYIEVEVKGNQGCPVVFEDWPMVKMFLYYADLHKKTNGFEKLLINKMPRDVFKTPVVVGMGSSKLILLQSDTPIANLLK